MLKQGLVPDIDALRDGFRRVLVSNKTEIKFAVDKGRKLAVMERIGETARELATYETIYFDTDKSDLRRHNVELCVRNRDGRLVQKIKTPVHSGNGLLRQSHEMVLNDLQPNLGHARASLPPIVRDVISQATLRPVFCTRFSRVRANDPCTTRASFDEGHIEATGRSELISEFKLKSGSLASYTQDCLSFLGRVPATLLVESKAARGYRLAKGELPRAVNAPHFSIAWDLPVPEAILRVFRQSFQHFLDNHPAVTVNGAPESIHQMRVAVRRLRSAIRVFGPVLLLEGVSGILGGLKALFAKLGEVREADVFLGETLPLIAQAGLGARLESVLLREVTSFRDRTYCEVRGELLSPEVACLVIRLNDWIESRNWLKADRPIDALLVERSTEDFAVPRIRTLYSKLLK